MDETKSTTLNLEDLKLILSKDLLESLQIHAGMYPSNSIWLSQERPSRLTELIFSVTGTFEWPL